MSGTGYPTGYEQVFLNWQSENFEWMLLTTAYVPYPTSQVFVTDVSTYEFTDGSYGRIAMSTPTTTVILPSDDNGFGGSISYSCDDPSFGVISGGEVAGWLVLYHVVTNDADSQLVAALPCGYEADSRTAADFVLPALGAITISTYCSGAMF
ncbi:MAG: hypothetical protein WCQ11_07010 [Actinomycetes bacterium]